MANPLLKGATIEVVVQAAARICHEVNRAYCQSLGDDSHHSWDDAPQWARDSALAGVRAHFEDPTLTAEDSHRLWLLQKAEDGWSYGVRKDPARKEHPCFVPYDALPAEQRTKDHLFKAVCNTVYQLFQLEKLARKS